MALLKPSSILTLALVCLMPIFEAARADELSLIEAQEISLKNSPQVLRSRSQAKEMDWKKTEAFSTYLPTLNLSSQYLFGYKYLLTDISFGGQPTSVPAVIPTSQTVLQLNYNLFDGFSGTNRYQAADSLYQSSQKESDWTEFTTKREVALLYFKTVSAVSLKEVAERNLNTLNEHLSDIELFRKTGISTNYDVLRVQVQVSEAQSELANANDNIEISLEKLSDSLGGVKASPRIKELPVASQSWLEKIQNIDTQNRQDLAAIRGKVRAAELNESASGRYLVPKINLFGQYQYYNNANDRFDDSNKYREAYQYGILLSWNIFDGMVSVSRSKQSIEQRYQMEQAARSLELKSNQDLQVWKRKLLYYVKLIQSKKTDIERSNEAVRLAKEARKVGARTNSELLDAELELFKSRAALVNAEMGAIESIINLEIASGQTLVDWEKVGTTL